MKNDSYKRFIKSDLYQKCLESDRTGKPLPCCSPQDCDVKVPLVAKKRVSLSTWIQRKPFK